MEMLALLRMNRKFMEFMRQNHNDVVSQPFNQTVLRESELHMNDALPPGQVSAADAAKVVAEAVRSINALKFQ